MILEEMFCELYDKYGKDFNWYMIPSTQADGAFVAELNKEIGQDHFLYGKKITGIVPLLSGTMRGNVPTVKAACLPIPP